MGAKQFSFDYSKFDWSFSHFQPYCTELKSHPCTHLTHPKSKCTSEPDLIWKQGLLRCQLWKILGSSHLGCRVGPKPMTGVLVRRADTDTGQKALQSQMQTGERLPQAKECVWPPAAGRGREELSPRAFGGSMAHISVSSHPVFFFFFFWCCVIAALGHEYSEFSHPHQDVNLTVWSQPAQ